MSAKILVVDDRPTNRQFLSTLLGYGGHRLLEAEDGAEALKLVRSERPDLVITDILMPTMDGFEFAKSVRADPAIADTKIVFYTATYRAHEARLLASACGVSTVIAKPAEPQTVLDVVNEQLGIAAVRSAPRKGKKLREKEKDASEPELSQLGVLLTDHVNDLRGLKRQLDTLVETGEELEKERERLRGISAKFAQNMAKLHTTSARLYAMLELGIDLSTMRDPQKLAELFTASARRLLGAGAAVTLLLRPTEDAALHVATEGLPPETAQALRSIVSDEGLVGKMMASRKVVNASAPKDEPSVEGLPAGYPPARNFLGAAIRSASGCYGLTFFTDKLGGTAGFGEEDEKLVQALALELAVVYENFELYDMVQKHAAGLQLEVAERQRAEARVRRLNRVYAVLSGINNLIVRTRSREELFEEACRIAVEEGQFISASIATYAAGAEKLVLAAHRGTVLPQLSAEGLSTAADASFARATAVRAVRERVPLWDNDITADPDMGPRRAQAIKDGARSIISLPLIVEGAVAGVLVLFAPEKGFFDDDEVVLLKELAGDIAFAINHLQKSARVDYLSYYDELTGFANRALFVQRLTQQLATSARERHRLALILMDVERFRSVNESFGRQEGDRLLEQIAARMRVHSTDPTWLARIGPDHFAIFVPDMGSEEALGRRIEQRLQQIYGEPFRVGGEDLRVAARLGVAVFPEDASGVEDLLRSAEAALRQAKERGERYVFFDRRMTERIGANLALESQLRRAVEQEEFVLHYQPKVDLESREIVGLEALIRWRSPELGLVPPGKFIPLLEETGLILPVGAWALGRAVRDQRRLAEQKLALPRIAVNVSPVQLRHSEFVRALEQAIAGDPPAAIDVEVTEGVFMEDLKGCLAKLNAVRALGVNVAIDDFGTGYSSLGYLAKLPAQTLKIDRSFVATMLNDADAMTLVQTIISLAHSLRLTVVAEGVESEDQAKMLRLLRCDQMQGYLISKPVPFEELCTLLRPGGASRTPLAAAM